MKIQNIFFFIVLFSYNLSQAYYLYAENEISVRATSSPKSDEIHKILPGETFEVVKWNNYNTRIRLSDGTIGFIDKSYVAAYAPRDNSGYLVKPLKLTTTQDKTDMYKQRPGISLDYKPEGGTSNAENPSGQSDMIEEDVIGDESDAIFTNTPTDTNYQEEAEYAAPPANSSSPSSTDINKLANAAWHQATVRRKRADFIGGGYASGNVSKSMCAAAVKDALVQAGICTSRPAGNARNTHTDGTLKNSCPKLNLSKQATSSKKLSVTDISQAPAGSVIVYSGYAGNKPHNYGHIEIKVPVTKELRTKMGRSGLNVKEGDFVYCSDFCRATPTKKSTNSVIAIYTI